MESVRINIEEIAPNAGQVEGLPINPRSWTKGEVAKLAKSLKETPELYEARPIIVYPYDGQYVILGGNMRLAASIRNGDKDVPCVIIPEGTPLRKLKEIVIKDNASFGAWDYDALANEWDDLPLADFGVPAWEAEDVDDEGNFTQGEVEEDDFDEDEGEIHVLCAKGDIWQLGEHTLMCGDSTDLESVKKLMGGG